MINRSQTKQLVEANQSARQALLVAHVEALRRCVACPRMMRPAVSGGPVLSKVLLVGQAPGVKEPVAGRPFAWTAGKTLFHWFQTATGITEAEFRAQVYMAAVCRCFPGKAETGGDRVPDRDEIARCSSWLEREMELLQPQLIIPVGKLAIQQFLAGDRLDRVIGRQFHARWKGSDYDIIPLPHPSGASTWHRMEPGRTMLEEALRLIARHAAFPTPMSRVAQAKP